MIEVKNLCFSYQNNINAVDDVSFTVDDHKWISIIGHNGSGKSTISKLLVGLLEPKSGEILYDGVLLNNKSANEIRKHVGIVFQNPDNQFVGINVLYDIAFGLENHLVPREEMKKLILEYSTKVGMQDYLNREPNSLSGGQKQRVAIAGILAMNCDTIILDEATSMLDPEGVMEITSLIKKLKNTYNKTIITITHDLDLASYSDEVLVMKDGKLIASGKPEEIFENRELLQSSNLDMPFRLRFYHKALEDEKLKNNCKLMEALWEYHFMK